MRWGLPCREPPHPVPLPRWGEGIQNCAPLPGTGYPLGVVWERAPRGYPVRVSGGIRELSGLGPDLSG